MTADMVRNAVDNLAGHMARQSRVDIGVSDRPSGPGAGADSRAIDRTWQALGDPVAIPWRSLGNGGNKPKSNKRVKYASH